MVSKSINEKINSLFVDLMVSYYYLGIPSFSTINYSVREELEDMSGYGSHFADLMLEFILCHEYIHVCSPVTRPPANRVEKIEEKINRHWSEEFGADTLGLYVSMRSKDWRQSSEMTPGKFNVVNMANAFMTPLQKG